nr:hypothetical protein Q903MT_gene193 [Picea sitchensis]
MNESHVNQPFGGKRGKSPATYLPLVLPRVILRYLPSLSIAFFLLISFKPVFSLCYLQVHYISCNYLEA